VGDALVQFDNRFELDRHSEWQRTKWSQSAVALPAHRLHTSPVTLRISFVASTHKEKRYGCE
jgi:hypothetical protein